MLRSAARLALAPRPLLTAIAALALTLGVASAASWLAFWLPVWLLRHF